MMQVTRRSLFSGKTTTRELDITPGQYQEFLRGELVQLAFPNLSKEDREFVLTGALPGEFEEAFPDE